MRIYRPLLLPCLLCFSMMSAAQDFYVSPLGSDQADGLTAQIPAQQPGGGPFQSLERAQRAIRNLKAGGQFKQPVQIHLATGDYQLRKTLEFDIRDTGFADREIVWQAEKNVTLSGGVTLLNCAKTADGPWSCPVRDIDLSAIKYQQTSSKKGDIPGFNLFVNQHRLHLARWPDKDWAHIKIPADQRTRFTSFEQMPAISGNQVQTHIFAGNDWSDEYLPVASIDTVNNEITLAAATGYPLASGRRFYLQNIQSELNAPEEWFYDQANARILFYPPENVTPENIVISALPTLFKLDGAHHIKFAGMAFRHCTAVCISIDHGNKLQLDGVEINNIDGTAISAENSSDITIANSHIHDTGGSGVVTVGGDINTLQADNNLIHNNHIHHFGMIMLGFSPAIESKGVGSRITHNLIEQASGPAVSINGNDHLFEKNEVHHVCEQLSDCGAIYSGRNWTWRGNIIRYNSIHDLYGYGLQSVDIAGNTVKYSSPNGARGVYLDDGLSSFTISGNIFYKAGISIHLGGGRDNRIDNNYIYTDDYAILIDNRWPDYNWAVNRDTLKNVPYLSPIWREKYPELAQPIKHDNWPEGNTITHNIIVSTRGLGLHYALPAESSTIAHNLVWATNGKFSLDFDLLDKGRKQMAASWQDWLKEGVEKNSLEADPCARLDGNRLSFCPNSPIHEIGFKALPDDIGLIRRD
ncbi:MAG: right-handed parallel beta-helix repeat-containing protein [Methylococcales bacterium]|nr:right-handed parallel beta-helix repeat-containing protein [Methylococcales bacterium]